MEDFQKMSPVKIFAVIFAVVILAAIVGSSRIQNNNKSSESPKGAGGQKQQETHISIDKFVPFIPKTFKITLEYNTQTKKLALKEFGIMSDDIKMDERLSFHSLYEIELFDKSNNSLLRQRVTINENLFLRDYAKAESIPQELITALYIPYNAAVVKMVLYKSGAEILSIPISQAGSPSRSKIGKISGDACEPIVVAVIGDGYSDMAEFRRQAETLISGLGKVEPFTPDFFDFKIYENNESMGCTKSTLQCINSPALHSVVEKARTQTGASTALILSKGGGTPGVAFMGTGPAVVDVISSARSYTVTDTAVHEFLGHGMGNLYDRYINDSVGIALKEGIRSNCTDNPSGEAFWSGVGGGAYPGCGLSKYYAPFPPTCGSAGNPSTSMGNCNDHAHPSFDKVEQAWIRNNILPVLSCGAPPPPPGGAGPGGASPTGGVAPTIGGGQGTLSTTISWDTMSGASSYEVIWIAGPTNTGKVKTTGTSYSFNNLLRGSYSWKIFALDDSGNRTGDNEGVGKLVP